MNLKKLVLMKTVFFVVCFLAVGMNNVFAAPVSMTSLNSPYTQNFNTLANGGSSSALPGGWDFIESGTNANTVYNAGTGSANAGDTYSFGPAGSAERALGMLLSNSLTPLIGAAFTNNTGRTVNSIDIAYTGEQWRMGALGRVDHLDFQYAIDASGLNAGTWYDVNSLDFSSPVTTGSVGALDGNSASTLISSTITGLSIPSGSTFWIRWTDFNVPGADDGLAVDDFSLTMRAAAVPEPASVLLLGAGLLGLLGIGRKI